MRTYLLGLFGLTLVALMACQEAPSEPDAQPGHVADALDPRDQFIGTWKLVRVERYGADDERLPPPQPGTFGAGEPLGYLMYDGAHMGVVIQQEGRQPYAGDRRTPEEALAAVTTYTSYFGTYSVNEGAGYVTHHVKGSLSPRGTGADNQRLYEFGENQLALKPPRGAAGVQLRIVWEKMPDRAALTPEARRFLGFWEIDSVERKTLGGESLPADQYAEGYIIYTPSEHMAVHLMRPDRQPYAENRPTPAEAEAAMRSYASYFGSFTVHTDEAYVLHRRTGNVGSNGVGVDAQRFYEFRDNQLILKPPVATVDGRQVQSYIHWNRISTFE